MHKQILVVDDNAVNRRVAKGFLQKYGAKVTSVESGMAALKVLKLPHNFDACFMDLQMRMGNLSSYSYFLSFLHFYCK